jgi:hypothetical protein
MAEALHLYAERYDDPGDTAVLDRELRATATAIYDWLTGPAHLFVTIGPVLDEDGNPDPHPDNNGGQPVQLRITDPSGRPYHADLSVAVFDAVGNEITDDPGTTTDDLAWTLDSGDGVVSTAVSIDTRTCTVTAASIGSGVVRVSLGELTGTVAVDVIAGDAAELRITEGEPTSEQPAPEPEPGV